MRYTLIVLLLLAALPVHAQDSRAVRFYVAGAVADELTTYRNINAGGVELDPMYGLTKHSATGTVLSLAITDAITLWLAHRYAHSHPKLVNVTLFALGSVRYRDAAANQIRWMQH